jgi:hypothetical protein
MHLLGKGISFGPQTLFRENGPRIVAGPLFSLVVIYNTCTFYYLFLSLLIHWNTVPDFVPPVRVRAQYQGKTPFLWDLFDESRTQILQSDSFQGWRLSNCIPSAQPVYPILPGHTLIVTSSLWQSPLSSISCLKSGKRTSPPSLHPPKVFNICLAQRGSCSTSADSLVSQRAVFATVHGINIGILLIFRVCFSVFHCVTTLYVFSFTGTISHHGFDVTFSLRIPPDLVFLYSSANKHTPISFPDCFRTLN